MCDTRRAGSVAIVDSLGVSYHKQHIQYDNKLPRHFLFYRAHCVDRRVDRSYKFHAGLWRGDYQCSFDPLWWRVHLMLDNVSIPNAKYPVVRKHSKRSPIQSVFLYQRSEQQYTACQFEHNHPRSFCCAHRYIQHYKRYRLRLRASLRGA